MTALAGLRVLDASSVVMGPYAARLLADLGAEVIKVEPPGGDTLRKAGQGGAMFAHLNRNKRAIVLDLKSSKGRDELLRLAREADVLLHNMRPHAAARLGLRSEVLQELNPALIVVSAIGYGSTGPYGTRPAYDDLIQAASGLAEINGRASLTGMPSYVPLTLADRFVGTHVAFAITAALACRERSGVAQHVEVPMFETFADLVVGDHLGGLSFEPPEGDTHYARLLSAQRRPYRTSDGWIAVLLYTEAHWRRFFQLLDREAEFEAEARLSDRTARQVNIDFAYGQVAEALSARATAEWLDSLTDLDIPVAPVHDVRSLVEDAHLNAVGFWRDVPLPDGRTLRTTAPVGRWSETAPARLRPPPLEPEDATQAEWTARP